MTKSAARLRIEQANIFYNFALGLSVTRVDLVKTAGKLLQSGLTQAVCFSDLKCLFRNDRGDIKVEWVQPEGRQSDSSWKVGFSQPIPPAAAKDILYAIQLAFHERKIEAPESKQVAPYLRAALPPIVLESDNNPLLLYTWVKVFSDGIVILTFQLDTTWAGIDEHDWISDFVNISRRYFDAVWVNAEVQRLDAHQLLPHAFQDEISIAGRVIGGRKSRRLMEKLRKESQAVLDDALAKDGREFAQHDERWVLHEVAGSERKSDWEATIDTCRSIFTNAIAALIVPRSHRKPVGARGVALWQGRPAVSLMRFREQPSTKDGLLTQFGPSMSRILMRSARLDSPPELPTDLRPFEDFCFHGNRSLLLWTWLRRKGEPDDAWKDPRTIGIVTEHQARAEHFEYHNIRVARACALAGSPESYQQLAEAYDTLVSAEDSVQHSSQAGEITDALSYLISAVGTAALVPSGKERARWRLDEFLYRAERLRARTDRWLTFVFGLVGAAGIADLVIKPFLVTKYPGLSLSASGLLAFLVACLVVGILAAPVWAYNRRALQDRG